MANRLACIIFFPICINLHPFLWNSLSNYWVTTIPRFPSPLPLVGSYPIQPRLLETSYTEKRILVLPIVFDLSSSLI
jgi:hypothetical protein